MSASAAVRIVPQDASEPANAVDLASPPRLARRSSGIPPHRRALFDVRTHLRRCLGRLSNRQRPLGQLVRRKL